MEHNAYDVRTQARWCCCKKRGCCHPGLIESVSQAILPGLRAWVRSVELPPLSAPKRFCFNRSRSDQLPQGNPGRPDAAGRAHPGLVTIAGGCTGHPEQVREPARSGAFCPAPSRCAHGVSWDRTQAPSLGFRLHRPGDAVLRCSGFGDRSGLLPNRRGSRARRTPEAAC